MPFVTPPSVTGLLVMPSWAGSTSSDRSLYVGMSLFGCAVKEFYPVSQCQLSACSDLAIWQEQPNAIQKVGPRVLITSVISGNSDKRVPPKERKEPAGACRDKNCGKGPFHRTRPAKLPDKGEYFAWTNSPLTLRVHSRLQGLCSFLSELPLMTNVLSTPGHFLAEIRLLLVKHKDTAGLITGIEKRDKSRKQRTQKAFVHEGSSPRFLRLPRDA